jgi:hypothetical protein
MRRIYSRVPPEVLKMILEFCEQTGVNRSEAIAVLVLIGLRYAALVPYDPVARAVLLED